MQGSSSSLVTALLYSVLALTLIALVSPCIGFRDAGELGAATFHLGIPHPTGFPLAMIMGKLASLLPLGDVALRLNIANALAMAGAITFAIRVVIDAVSRNMTSRLVPVVGGFVVGASWIVSPTLSWLGTSIEVYGWAALLVCAAIWCATRSIDTKDPRYALATLLMVGLAAGCHVSAVMGTSAAAAASVVAVTRSRRLLGVGVAYVAAGLLIILYLPVRASACPAVMWDDLSTASGLYSHLTASRIREAFEGSTTMAHIPANISMLGRLLTEDGGAVAFILGPAAAILCWSRGKLMVLTLGTVIVLDILYSLLVNPMGIVDRQVGWLASVGLITLAGLGAAELVARLRSTASWVGPGLMGVIVLATLLLRPVHPTPPPADHIPWLWARDTMEAVPPRAVILCNSDDMCGLGLWFSRVEGTRPDVSVVPRQHLWNRTAVTQGLGTAHPKLLSQVYESGAKSKNTYLAKIIEQAGGWGVLWEVGDGSDLDAAFGRGPPPLFYGRGATPPLVSVGGGTPVRSDLLAHTDRIVRWITLAGMDPDLTPGVRLHFHTQRLLARDLLGVGLVMAWKRQRAVAEEAFSVSIQIKPDYAPALINLAILEARDGNLESAIELARRAGEADPLHDRGRELIEKLTAMQKQRSQHGDQ